MLPFSFMLFIQSAIAKQFFIAVELGNLLYEDDDEFTLVILKDYAEFVMYYYFNGFRDGKFVFLTCDINSLTTMEQCNYMMSESTDLIVKLYKNHNYIDKMQVYHQFDYSLLSLSFNRRFSLQIDGCGGLTPLLYCYQRDSQTSAKLLIPGAPVADNVSLFRCQRYDNVTFREGLQRAAHINLFNRTVVDNWNYCEIADFSLFEYCDVYFLEDQRMAHRVLITRTGNKTAEYMTVLYVVAALCIVQLVQYGAYMMQQVRHRTTIPDIRSLVARS